MLNSLAMKLGAPLRSWDFFMEAFGRHSANAKDITAIAEIAKTSAWKKSFDIHQKLVRQDQVIIITDLSQTILFATHNILAMTGYRPAELMGKAPNILQGVETNADTRATIREAIKQLMPFQAEIINYRKNGTTYKCHVEAQPVFNKKGLHTHFIAFEHEVDL